MNRIAHTTGEPAQARAGKTLLSQARLRRAGGFTLIELSVVIMIILLLVGMLLPTAARVRTQALVSASHSDIAILDRGCQLYYDDNKKEYPLSGAGPGDNGGQRLVYFLVASGKDYGCGYVPTVKQGDQVEQRSFADRFGHAILYYRFERRGNDPEHRYYNQDNPSDSDGLTGPADADLYAKFYDRAISKLVYGRADFLLMSSGPDAKFADPKGPDATDPDDDVVTDDITNFLSQ